MTIQALSQGRHLSLWKTDMRTCPTCRIGTLQRKMTPYAGWRGDEFVVIPALPAWLCDVCGERTYDQAALDSLLSLIGPPSPMSDEDAATGVQRGVGSFSPAGNTRTRRRA